MFPIIKHIDDVLPHIKDNKNFIVRDKGDYTYIDYILNTPEMFQNPYERECRGIIFDKEGKLISRPYHKFFNVNEREETRNLDLNQPHVILEKLDGSMVRPFKVGDRIIWGTKAGETHITSQVEAYVDFAPSYEWFAEHCIKYNFTPIFEWCSRQNRIVIDHPEPKLVLTAVRHNETGGYIPYRDLEWEAQFWLMALVGCYEGTPENMEALVAHTRDLQGAEGYVVRFGDGRMVKIKADEYCRFHSAKEDLEKEKNIVHMIVTGTLDDFKPLLMKEDLQRIEEFEIDVLDELMERAYDIWIEFMRIKINGMSRKDFALEANDLSKTAISILFKVFDEPMTSMEPEGFFDMLKKFVEKSCSSQTKIDSVRHLWNNHKWEDYLPIIREV